MKTEQGEIPALFSCWEAWGVGDAPAGLARRLRRGRRACSPMGRSIASGGGRSEGAWGRAESPQCARRRIPSPPVGNNAPTPAWEKGLQPYGTLDYFRRRTEGFQRGT